jgi:hypothetical protein
MKLKLPAGMDNPAFRMEIVKTSKENKEICLCNGERESLINKAFLKNPQRFPHRLICKA